MKTSPVVKSSPKVLIIGGSVRAAAASARRAGWEVIAYDQYGDLDLQETSLWQPLPSGSANWSLSTAAVEQSLGWTYAGPFENWPEEAVDFSKEADKLSIPLLGASPSLLKRIRDPFFLQQMFASVGGKPLEIITPQEVHAFTALKTVVAERSDVRSWIRKPLNSGGGVNVCDASQLDLEESPSGLLSEREYLQERVDGVPQTCIFLADSCGVQRVGWTEGLIGTSWGKYGYRGSAGPVSMAAAIDEMASSMAHAIVEATGLVGVFGIDGIRCGESWRPIEINPRYTASCEILEWTDRHSTSLMDRHLRAWIDHFQGSSKEFPAKDVSAPSEGHEHFARPDFGYKQIIYAGVTFNAPDLRPLLFRQQSGEFRGSAQERPPVIADIPTPGTVIERGHPVCTLFGWGDSLDVAHHEFLRNLCQLEDRFPQLKLS